MIFTGKTAVPVVCTIQITARCVHCDGELARTGGDERFPWFHRDTGRETCE